MAPDPAPIRTKLIQPTKSALHRSFFVYRKWNGILDPKWEIKPSYQRTKELLADIVVASLEIGVFVTHFNYWVPAV